MEEYQGLEGNLPKRKTRYQFPTSPNFHPSLISCNSASSLTLTTQLKPVWQRSPVSSIINKLGASLQSLCRLTHLPSWPLHWHTLSLTLVIALLLGSLPSLWLFLTLNPWGALFCYCLLKTYPYWSAYWISNLLFLYYAFWVTLLTDVVQCITYINPKSFIFSPDISSDQPQTLNWMLTWSLFLNICHRYFYLKTSQTEHLISSPLYLLTVTLSTNLAKPESWFSL